MKKIYLLIIGVLMILMPIKAKAVGVTTEAYAIKGKVVVHWYDFEDKLGMRPDKITIPLHYQIDAYYDLDLNVKDAIVENDGEFTTWTFNNVVIYLDNHSIEYLDGDDHAYFTNPPKSYIAYENSMNGLLAQDDLANRLGIEPVLNVYLYKDIWKTVKFKITFDDDNGRDIPRKINFRMYSDETDSEESMNLTWKDKDIDYIETERTLKYLIHDVDKGEPLEIATYKLELLERVEGFEYELRQDDSDNIIFKATHKADKIKLPFKVTWLTNNILNEIEIEAINQNGEVESTFKITKDDDWQTIAELYKNMKYSFGEEEVEYTFNIKGLEKYEYELIENEEGYEITISGNEVEEEPEKNVEESQSKTEENIMPPETSDDIMTYLKILLISSICIYASIRKLKKSFN